MPEEENLQQLMQAFNDHQITDEEGNLSKEETETSVADSSPQDETTETETPEVEDNTDQASEADDQTPEPEVGVDDTGKRYVPQKRFDKVYGEKKALERENQALKQKVQVNAPMHPPASPQTPQSQGSLENDLLFATLPQFDPDSDDYDPDLDDMAATIYKANPGITKIQAAKQAIKKVKSLASKEIAVKSEARKVKALQADQGITSRNVSRGSQVVDPEKMTLAEKEAWLKQTGNW